MHIYILSRGRAERQITWRNLGFPLQKITDIVVYATEETAYRSAGYDNLWVIPNDPRNVGYKRQYIMEHASEDHVVLLDDDLYFYRRISQDRWSLRYSDQNEMVELFDKIGELLSNYAHVSVSMREGNNRHYPAREIFNQRYCRVLAYNRNIVKNCDFMRSHGLLEDFDVALQLLSNGHRSAIIADWAQGHRGTNTPGGCSEYRTHGAHEQSVLKLAELWPDFVFIRDKSNKSGGEFGHRKEVTIRWAKAYASSQR